MKFTIKKPEGENIYNLIRKAGYSFREKDETKEELVFVRPARTYPRFHLYLRIDNGNLIFNLHLDQKKPSYKGAVAHSGEYGGKIIDEEAERIKKEIF